MARAPSRWVGIYNGFDILQPRTASSHSLTPHFLRRHLKRSGFETELSMSGPPDRAKRTTPRGQNGNLCDACDACDAVGEG